MNFLRAVIYYGGGISGVKWRAAAAANFRGGSFLLALQMSEAKFLIYNLRHHSLGVLAINDAKWHGALPSPRGEPTRGSLQATFN